MEYTINQIQETVNVSLQSLYALIKKNKPFIAENSIRKQRKVYYNQAAMDFFVSYYCPEKPLETLKIPPKSADSNSSANSTKEAAEAKIEALEAEIEALKKQLEDKEAERLELFKQNGALILTISQLQQEKMLLLPAPKVSFSDKVKSIFKGKAKEH